MRWPLVTDCPTETTGAGLSSMWTKYQSRPKPVLDRDGAADAVAAGAARADVLRHDRPVDRREDRGAGRGEDVGGAVVVVAVDLAVPAPVRRAVLDVDLGAVGHLVVDAAEVAVVEDEDRLPGAVPDRRGVVLDALALARAAADELDAPRAGAVVALRVDEVDTR